MTSITSKIRYLEKLAINNSPVLLTAIGVAGTVATAVLTHKAATKAETLYREEIEAHYFDGIPLNEWKKERVKLVWRCYIPPVATGALTIGAIIFANRIGTKRAAAMAAAYTISERAYSEYRDKVVEKIGETKERNLRDELVQDQVRRNPISEENFIVTSGDVMCCDLFSGRYFRSSVEDIKKAVNDTNYQIMHHQSATLTDFYDRVGLPRTDVSDEIGWNFDKLIEIEFTTVMKEDGQPCIAYRFPVHPVRGFHTLH